MTERHRHSENGYRYSHDHSGYTSEGERAAHLMVRHGETDAEFAILCDRIGCEHTYASHLRSPCDWCPCQHFLHPDHDDSAEERRSKSAVLT